MQSWMHSEPRFFDFGVPMFYALANTCKVCIASWSGGLANLKVHIERTGDRSWDQNFVTTLLGYVDTLGQSNDAMGIDPILKGNEKNSSSFKMRYSDILGYEPARPNTGYPGLWRYPHAS